MLRERGERLALRTGKLDDLFEGSFGSWLRKPVRRLAGKVGMSYSKQMEFTNSHEEVDLDLIERHFCLEDGELDEQFTIFKSKYHSVKVSDLAVSRKANRPSRAAMRTPLSLRWIT